MKFEWDERKNKINIQEHKIDFQDVIEIFNGPVIIKPDDRFYYTEERFIGTGLLKNMIVMVVFVERKEDIIRIISARKANKYESKIFQKEIRNRLG